MEEQQAETFFAPPGRVSPQLLLSERDLIQRSELITTLLNAMPDFLMVLNQKRQIVAVNQQLMKAFGVEDPEILLGLRPGEAAGCIHAAEGPDGCGSARNCSVCGAVLAILASQDTGLPQQRECHLMMGKDCSSLDLDVLATPVRIEDEDFIVLALRDISSEKRRHVIERVFFHDILNSAGGIRGLAAILVDGTDPVTEKQYKNWMVTLSDNLIEEINHQRRLLQAERGTYTLNLETVQLSDILNDVKHLYENHERTPGRTLVLDEPPSVSFVTDKALLRRIIGNMVLNALEASWPGDTVRLKADSSRETVSVSVENPSEMPIEVQLQVFKRSFTTKGKEGRGLGTYSMKLFGERYLGGKVGFRSEAGRTTFFIELPALSEKQGVSHNTPC